MNQTSKLVQSMMKNSNQFLSYYNFDRRDIFIIFILIVSIAQRSHSSKNQSNDLLNRQKSIKLGYEESQARVLFDNQKSDTSEESRDTMVTPSSDLIPTIKSNTFKNEQQVNSEEREDEKTQLHPPDVGNKQKSERAGRRIKGSSLINSLIGQTFTNQLYGQASQMTPFQLQLNHQTAECACVPFFQCKGGYLTGFQLNRIQIPQISRYKPYKLPRALAHPESADFSEHVPNEPGNLLSTSTKPSVISNEMIYEQLKRTIENENLEEVATRYDQSTKEIDKKKTKDLPINDNLYERSFLNPLIRSHNRYPKQKSCGIMSTCCRIPERTSIGQFASSDQLSLQSQHYPGAFQKRPVHSLAIPVYPQTSHFMNFPPQQQVYLKDNLAQASSYQQSANPYIHLLPHPRVQPFGNFMAGKCGVRQTTGVAGRIQNFQTTLGRESTAEFGEFPAHVAILKQLPGESLFLCSGVLISYQWLATAAHCIRKLRAEDLKVRLGEWDVSRDDEFYPFVESSISDIIVHPDHQPSNLINDLALLRMTITVNPQQMPHITPACLPIAGETFTQQRCWLTGWGKNAFGQVGSFQNVLKKVDLPIMDRQRCEDALRFNTKLGKYFRLHSSNICAGGERGKDACEGDGGAGLYCTNPTTGLTTAAGLVSWGIDCGQAGLPGVYTNLSSFYGWIQQIASDEESLYLDRNIALPADEINSLVNERTNANASKSFELFDSSLRNQETTYSNQELESRVG